MVCTPVVAFATGGVNEGIKHGETGLLSPEKNVQQLAENLMTLLTSNALRLGFAKAGIERAKTLFNIKSQCAILEKIYGGLC